MNPEIKKDWITDLRSGKFKQGRYSLRTVDPDTGIQKDCCLSVLTDQYIRKTGDSGYERDLDEINLNINTGKMQYKGSNFLHPSVKAWAGLNCISDLVDLPKKINGSAATTLAGLNDQESFTFDQIANVIEEQF